ncbi:YfcE family phosphodiesterase [Lottiidibacillus patelloidae]|uniref:Phosphoesterase n=1 Tax=Lottiidibacillus patelloidae TaxID=2670334 RepID=A0A263BVW9_9BACI|nr:metallophosphoesterase [Lottiidibacillus patelloidae]OZM57893.1 YfcE family phosphodiesterase [Lottiidibacillus patelloidae]
MNVLIISDTHGWKDQLLQVIERHKNEVDAIIHCGDSELPVDAKELEGVLTVQGNCDIAPFPEEIIQEINGKVFYITHGHYYNVKHSLMNLMYRSEEVGADIVCFGHSHVFTSERSNDKLFINPGSLKNPRLVTTGTYAIYTLHDDRSEEVTYYDLQGNVMKEWSKTF